MNVLIDIGHPAHVHLFKHFAWEMQKKRHKIFFTCRDKEFEIYLFEKYGFSYKSFGRKYSTKIGKLFGLIEFDIKEFLAGLALKPDIFFSHGSIYAAHAAFLLRKPHISMEDTFNFEQINLYKPFTHAILTADYENPLIVDRKVIPYSGYHELAYLHPNRFTPDEGVLNELGVKKGEKYVIMRFVSWKATHDTGHKGISLENKIRAVGEFKKHARVFISSEAALPGDLEQYEIPIDPDRMHDALAFACLVYGESATMISEGAVLGTPGIFLDNTGRYYTKEQEKKYGLVFNFTESENDQRSSVKKGLEILAQRDANVIWNEKKDTMLADKIDTTSFMVWFIENYPQSFMTMKENPEYQLRFK
ncbi:MAG: DUF354 domain-containing protein [Desulfobacteraceae bacterium]|nr:DUF354 domain-containing protein [Desulfobacteraceae bacterium]